ncbi:hypothetical protein [Nocardia thailandica]
MVKIAVGAAGFLVLIAVLGDGAGNALCVLSIVGLVVWLFATAGPLESPSRRPLGYARRRPVPEPRRGFDEDRSGHERERYRPSGRDRFAGYGRDRVTGYGRDRLAGYGRDRWDAADHRRDRRDPYADERRHFSGDDREDFDRSPRARRAPGDHERWSRGRRADGR